MRHRKRHPVNHPTVDVDRAPHGGHDLEQIDDHDDDSDYWYRCTLCHGVVSGWEIEEGHWPARLGRYCAGILVGLTR
jgi:hypothetical protein